MITAYAYNFGVLTLYLFDVTDLFQNNCNGLLNYRLINHSLVPAQLLESRITVDDSFPLLMILTHTK